MFIVSILFRLYLIRINLLQVMKSAHRKKRLKMLASRVQGYDLDLSLCPTEQKQISLRRVFRKKMLFKSVYE